MSMFPDYLVEITDRKFDVTFETWVTQVLTDISDLREDPFITFTDYLELNLITTIKKSTKLNTYLPKVINSTLRAMEANVLDDYIIAFPATHVPLRKLHAEISSFLTKRRRKDYELYMFSSHSLSLLVDRHKTNDEYRLLDNPMPNLTMLMISYYGTKRIL